MSWSAGTVEGERVEGERAMAAAAMAMAKAAVMVKGRAPPAGILLPRTRSTWTCTR